LHRTDDLERDELRSANGWQLWGGNDVECGYERLRSFHGWQLRRTHDSRWARRLHGAFDGQLHRTDDLERDELRSANGWQLWGGNDVECGYEHLRSFHGWQLRRTHGLERDELRGIRRHIACRHDRRQLHRVQRTR